MLGTIIKPVALQPALNIYACLLGGSDSENAIHRVNRLDLNVSLILANKISSIRYQLTNTWLSPFVEVSYQFGSKRLIADYVQTNHSSPFSAYSLTPGINLWVQKHLWLEVALSFRSARERHLFSIPLATSSSPLPTSGGGLSPSISVEPTRYKGPLPQLGLVYQFKRSKKGVNR